MATLDLDPVFLKALTLLHSKHKDSAEQLRQMVYDSVASSEGKLHTEHKGSDSKSMPSSSGVPRSILKKDHSVKPTEHIKEAEKRAVEKIKQDLSDLGREAKKPKLEEIVPKKKTESLFLKEFEEPSTDGSSDKAGDSTDADDFAMEMGLACVLCRQLDVAPGNQLVECQECHDLYHQKCHKPAATDAEVNDPRVVWYCTKCSRSIKKMASKQKSKASHSPTVSKESVKRPEEDKKKESVTLVPFKRSEPNVVAAKSSAPGSTAATHQPLVGLASLAANLSGKPTITQTSSSTAKPSSSFKSSIPSASSSKSARSSLTKSSSTFLLPSKGSSSAYSSSASSKSQQPKTSSSSARTPSVSSATSTANAMKRLQMMKKKAAKR